MVVVMYCFDARWLGPPIGFAMKRIVERRFGQRQSLGEACEKIIAGMRQGKTLLNALGLCAELRMVPGSSCLPLIGAPNA